MLHFSYEAHRSDHLGSFDMQWNLDTVVLTFFASIIKETTVAGIETTHLDFIPSDIMQ